MLEFYHSVTLDEERCMGCTNCIKRCPTEAIRVRDGKARIITERCIDCGECIRVCPHHAKKAVCDSLSRLQDFTYTIALPAPMLYGQFSRLSEIDYVLTGLLEMGFDDVYEISRAAEIVSDATRQLLHSGNLHLPLISSACPAVVRLIRARFPDLCENVLPLYAPMHLAAQAAKMAAQKKTGLPLEEIGAFFLSPCPAKITDVKQPIGLEKSWVDGAFSVAEIYPRLLEKMNRIDIPRQLAQSGIIGVGWASSGGEASALIRERYLAADGMENIMSVLDEMENGVKLQSLEFAELNACPGGCVGGVLAVENAYVAKANIQRLRKYLPISRNHLTAPIEQMMWDSKLEYAAVLELSSDIGQAMAMMTQIDALTEELPGLDCGSCGAPSCRALAEDIVTRGARKNDCVFILRQEASSVGISVSQNLMNLCTKNEEETDGANNLPSENLG